MHYNGFLKGGGAPSVNIETIEINGGDEQGVMKAIPALKEAIIEAVTEDIANGGATVQTIRTYV